MKPLFRSALPLVLAIEVLPAALRAAPQPLRPGAKPENFTLTAPDGKQHSLRLKEWPKATLVLFIGVECPISNAYDGRLVRLADEYRSKGVRFLAINSNKQERMAEVGDHAKKSGFPFPVLKDPRNVVADRWGALVTPEAFVLDRRGVLQYHGRIDDSQGTATVKSPDLKNALDAVLAGKKPAKPETKVFGCIISRI